MRKGERVTLLSVIGVLCLLGAIWVYSKAEDNSFEKFRQASVDAEGSAQSANDKCKELRGLYDNLSKRLEEMGASVEGMRKDMVLANTEWAGNVEKKMKSLDDDVQILKVRQHTLDKKIIAKEQTLNVKLNGEPIAVDIVDKRKPTPKGKDSLLKRSGVSP
jgi:hypothetical protein